VISLADVVCKRGRLELLDLLDMAEGMSLVEGECGGVGMDFSVRKRRRLGGAYQDRHLGV
jgi:hypothetical protein